MLKLRKHNPIQVVILVAAIVILGSLTGWLPVDRWAATIVRPITRPLGRAGGNLHQKFKELSHLGELEAENQRLREQNQELSQQQATFYQLQEADRQLREQLGLSQRSSLNLIAADVTAHQSNSLRRLLIINRGSKDGLKLNMPVVVSGGLVGRISQLHGHSSEVMLINDPDFRALVTTKDGTTGVIRGQPGGLIIMERIPQGQPIAAQGSVFTSGMDDLFPRGLVIGRVENVQTSHESIFSSAQIRPLISLDLLEVVMVVLQ